MPPAASPVELHHQHYPARQKQGRPLIILHGLLGASGNWHTLGRTIFSEDRDVYALDQRNHGRSPHAEASGYADMAADLERFIEAHALAPAAVLGHSMGGKTAMHAALAFPDQVERLVVADIAPKAYPPHHQSIFDALNALDLEALDDRNAIDEALAEHIAARPVRQFLLKNLDYDADADRYRWQMNLPAIEDAYDEIGGGLAETLRDRTYDGPALFVRGERSDYVADEDTDRLREHFPQARVETIAGAGHWLHADQPDAFAEVVTSFLEE